MEIPIKNGWFGGTTIFGNTHISEGNFEAWLLSLVCWAYFDPLDVTSLIYGNYITLDSGTRDVTLRTRRSGHIWAAAVGDFIYLEFYTCIHDM